MHGLLFLEQALLLALGGGGVAAGGTLVLEGHGLCWVWLGESNADAPDRGRALGLSAEEDSWGDSLGVQIGGAEEEACLLVLGDGATLGVVWDALEQGALLAHRELWRLLLALLWGLLLLHGGALLLQLGELSLGLVLKHGDRLGLAVGRLHGGDESQLLLLLLGLRVRGQVQGRPRRLLLGAETATSQNSQRVLEQGGLDLLWGALGLSQGPGRLKELLWRRCVGRRRCWEAGLDGEQLSSLLKEGHRLLSLRRRVDLGLKHLGLKVLLESLQHLLLLQLLLLLLQVAQRLILLLLLLLLL